MKRKWSVCLAIVWSAGATNAQINTDSLAGYSELIPGAEQRFSMAAIPAGRFFLGSPDSEPGRNTDEGPQRQVAISAFWMGTHEVTYDEFLLFFNDDQLSRNSEVDAVTRPTPQYIDLSWGMGKQGGFPVNSMSQRTALMYCRWLYRKTGHFYRLPTEAEWEYACRAGSNTRYFYGDDEKTLGDYAWYAANSKNKYHKTGQKKPNAWGLYDMLGNVAEWTLDQYHGDFYAGLSNAESDPMAPPETTYPRSVRGGSYLGNPNALRCAARSHSESSWNKRDPQIPKSKWWLTDAMGVGFRLVRPFKQPGENEIEAFFKKYLGE